MGEIADAMLEGELCQECGEYLGEGQGFPRSCAGCSPPVVNRGPKREPEGQSALPRFNRYAIPPRAGAVQCDHCPRWIMPSGMAEHMRAKHRNLIGGGSPQ